MDEVEEVLDNGYFPQEIVNTCPDALADLSETLSDIVTAIADLSEIVSNLSTKVDSND